MATSPPNRIRGRAAAQNPPSRFARIHLELDSEAAETAEPREGAARTIPTEYYLDDAQSVISENDSPDIPFRYSLNPYRGCSHGCSYCYARPTHEYLGLSAGLDFETKIFVKSAAPRLFREFLARNRWQPQPIALSGVTDCYQPAERHFEITRQCLEVALAARQPLSLVTKNALVTRDLDHLASMAEHQLVHVAISLTTQNQQLARVMEPQTSSPHARLQTIARLTAAGIPTSVLIAPVLPGLTDMEIPSLLQAAREHGAISASYTLLRLPTAVQPVFCEWLRRNLPDAAARVEARIRATHEGNLCSSTFGVRMKGSGSYAAHIEQTFQVFSRRWGLDAAPPALDTSHFRAPLSAGGQQRLF